MCSAAKKLQKFTKNLFLEVQSRLRSSTLINFKKPVASMYAHICNRFHVTRANNGKNNVFKEYPFLTPSFKGNPVTQRHKILSR